MTDNPSSALKSPRQRRTDAFLLAADLASVATLSGLVLGAVADPSKGLSGWLLVVATVTLIMLIYGSIGLLRHRRNDEFTLDLWNAGTNWLFAAVIVLGVFLPIGSGFYQGIVSAPEGDRRFSEWLDYWGLHLALSAFFVGFQVRRFGS